MFPEHLGSLVGCIYLNMRVFCANIDFCTVYEFWNRGDVSSGLSFVDYVEMISAVKRFNCRSILQLGGFVWTVYCTLSCYPGSSDPT